MYTQMRAQTHTVCAYACTLAQAKGGVDYTGFGKHGKIPTNAAFNWAGGAEESEGCQKDKRNVLELVFASETEEGRRAENRASEETTEPEVSLQMHWQRSCPWKCSCFVNWFLHPQ